MRMCVKMTARRAVERADEVWLGRIWVGRGMFRE